MKIQKYLLVSDLNICFQRYFDGFIYYAVKIKYLYSIKFKMNELYKKNQCF